MGKLQQDMERVHEVTDFKVEFAGVTEPGEFNYSHGGSVQPGLEYHIHYTNDKREVYMTGGAHNSSSKIIIKKDDHGLFTKYVNINSPSEKTSYPKKHQPNPSESDYRTGRFSRYFCQKANDRNGELFEVDKPTFDRKNSLYRFIALDWQISGVKLDVFRKNLRTILSFIRVRGNEQLSKILFPLQLWNPSEGSADDLRRKLQRRKKN